MRSIFDNSSKFADREAGAAHKKLAAQAQELSGKTVCGSRRII
jgi:hypothetical protein